MRAGATASVVVVSPVASFTRPILFWTGFWSALSFSFVITAIACGFTALCYAELASMIPVAGSAASRPSAISSSNDSAGWPPPKAYSS